MLGIYDIQDLISTSFFDGNMQIAGMALYAVVMIVLFALTKNTSHTLIVSLPVTLIFAAIGVLNTDLMVLLIVLSVMGLALNVSKVWRD